MLVKKISAVAGVLAVALVMSAQNVVAQGVPVAEAQAFLGAWLISVEGNALELTIKDEGGQVAADVIAMGATSKITTIAKVEDALNLSYVTDIGGQVAPISFSLKPEGENLATVINVGDGMFTANATATRKP